MENFGRDLGRLLVGLMILGAVLVGLVCGLAAALLMKS